MLNAKDLMIDIGGAKIPCAVFGKGRKNIIMLPGVGDGLQTVKGKAFMLALSYRKMSKDFRIFVMSRRLDLPEHFGTEEMADDIKKSMDSLGIEKASFIGVSMGGMIAQHFAAKFPERTEKVVLAVTTPKKTAPMDIISEEWLQQAKKGEGVALMRSSVYNMYSDDYYKKNGWLCEITGRYIMPKSYDRFIRMGFACLEHDASSVLKDIKSPVLIIGGSEDRTVGIEGSLMLKERIPGAELYIYDGLRHAVYDEAPDFFERIIEFLK